MDWRLSAAFSALFAGMTAVLAKVGISNVPSNLATLVRTIVIVIFASGIVIARGEWKSLNTFTPRTWTFLVLSGIATGISWLFYFSALKNGKVSQVAPIDKMSFVIAMVLGVLFLGEHPKPTTWAGAALIVTGVLLTLK
jgi:transporter family protein